MTTEDMELVRDFAAQNSEEAFATLVGRHVNLVYSVALRRVGDPHVAEEVTQAAFITLARKAGSLGPNTILPAWLCRTAHYAASETLRSRRRRERREQEACMQSTLIPAEPEVSPWPEIAPLLDDAMAGLRERDHSAIVLRFFEGKNFKQVGAALGVSENAAKKQVDRSLEKLRRFFSRRGVAATSAIIGGALLANSIKAAPAPLAKSITAMAMAKSVAAGGSSSTLIQGAWKIMAWTKAKMAIAAGIGLLLAGTAAVGVQKYEVYQASLDAWRKPDLSPKMLAKAPPQVTILPTKFKPPVYAQVWAPQDRYAGVCVTANELAWIAYRSTPGRVYFPYGEPKQRYDFATTIPENSKEGLQAAIKKKLGLAGKMETLDRNVLMLKVKTPNAPGLKPHDEKLGMTGFYDRKRGRIVSIGRRISSKPPDLPLGLPKLLEGFVGMPVVDDTGLTNRFDIDMRWDEPGEADPEHEALKKALADQLGLELVPETRPVEMLVMEKVK